jgi:hypothetical protein
MKLASLTYHGKFDDAVNLFEKIFHTGVDAIMEVRVSARTPLPKHDNKDYDVTALAEEILMTIPDE